MYALENLYKKRVAKDFDVMVKEKGITIDELAGMVARGFEDVGQRLDGLVTDVTELKSDVVELKSDVTELKSDVNELKTDVAELQTSVAVLQTDMTRIEGTVNRIDTRTQNQVDAVYADTTAVKADVR